VKNRRKSSFHAPSGRVGEKKKRTKKLLIWAAVILFAVFFGGDLIRAFRLSGDSGSIASSSIGVFSAEDDYVKEAETGIFGGPFSGLEQILMPTAQGAIDFTTDDEVENKDLVILQENSVIAPNSPDPYGMFGSFKKEIRTYIVVAGDNPEKIAAVFGISTNTLLWANNLRDRSIIKPGQELVILPINGVRIKAGPKDTIASLAKKYQGKDDEIIAFNNLPSDGALSAGEYIIIPGGEMPEAIAPKTNKATAPKYATSTQKAGNWLIVPATGRNWGRTHSYNGVDISNPCGTPIYAAAAGSVILSDGSGWNGGYGKYIKIQHPNGVVTLYAHLSSILVSGGDGVAQGQLIGYMGTTGRSTGCHLHFEVRGAKNPLAR
jgi:LysM repeat protein